MRRPPASRPSSASYASGVSPEAPRLARSSPEWEKARVPGLEGFRIYEGRRRRRDASNARCTSAECSQGRLSAWGPSRAREDDRAVAFVREQVREEGAEGRMGRTYEHADGGSAVSCSAVHLPLLPLISASWHPASHIPRPTALLGQCLPRTVSACADALDSDGAERPGQDGLY
ncbi:hypothetical protein GY45DRAFT_1324164 [Cubamyces sp. BRFM 1775]|nr:hypothetical protein GY45DRAFT_1324164 [Cubamyces sp. BRFM 1775]